MAKVLHLKPVGGLANRIRAVTCGMWCAQELGLELVVAWKRASFMPANFYELFKNELNTDVRKLSGRKKISIGMNQLIRSKLIIDQACLNDPRTEVLEICTGVAFSHRPEVSPWARQFGDTIRPYLHALVPVDPVAAEVKKARAEFRDRMFGVHLRTGREKLSYAENIEVTEAPFFEVVDGAVADIPELGLYVASDSRATVGRFQERYGSRVFTLKRNGTDIPRDVETADAVRLALVELLLLGQTHWLLGSVLSSFSEVAGWYKRRSFSVLGTNHRR